MATTTKTPTKTTATKPKKVATKPKKKPRVPEPEHPWDQQPSESSQSFASFILYRDMGMTRSIAKVAKQVGKGHALLNRWSQRDSWAIRVAAWDRELDREWQLEQKEARRTAAKRNAKIAQAAMAKVVTKLGSMTERDLDANSMSRLMEVASKLERLSLGESTDNVSVSGPGGGPVLHEDVSLLTDEERLHRMEVLQRELASRIGKSGE